MQLANSFAPVGSTESDVKPRGRVGSGTCDELAIGIGFSLFKYDPCCRKSQILTILQSWARRFDELRGCARE